MSAVKGRLKVALLVVGVVSFGMYGAFQVQEAEATHSNPWTCPIKTHKSGNYSTIGVLTPTSTYTTFQGNCPNCGWNGAPKTTHTYRKYWKTIYYSLPFEHKYPGQSNASYTFCHYHTSQSGSYIWKTEPCGG